MSPETHKKKMLPHFDFLANLLHFSGPVCNAVHFANGLILTCKIKKFYCNLLLWVLETQGGFITMQMPNACSTCILEQLSPKCSYHLDVGTGHLRLDFFVLQDLHNSNSCPSKQIIWHTGCQGCCNQHFCHQGFIHFSHNHLSGKCPHEVISSNIWDCFEHSPLCNWRD